MTTVGVKGLSLQQVRGEVYLESYYIPVWHNIVGLLLEENLYSETSFILSAFWYRFNIVAVLLQELIDKLVRPTPDWGPALPKHRTGRYAPGYKQEVGIWNCGIAPMERVIAPSAVTLKSYTTSSSRM